MPPVPTVSVLPLSMMKRPLLGIRLETVSAGDVVYGDPAEEIFFEVELLPVDRGTKFPVGCIAPSIGRREIGVVTGMGVQVCGPVTGGKVRVTTPPVLLKPSAVASGSVVVNKATVYSTVLLPSSNSRWPPLITAFAAVAKPVNCITSLTLKPVIVPTLPFRVGLVSARFSLSLGTASKFTVPVAEVAPAERVVGACQVVGAGIAGPCRGEGGAPIDLEDQVTADAGGIRA